MSARDSSSVIGGLQMRLRSEHHKQWSYPCAHQFVTAEAQAVAQSVCDIPVLVEKFQEIPTTWPPSHDRYLVIAIHTVTLSPVMQQHKFHKLQIFWNLLDSIVHAQQEATQELPAGSAKVDVSHMAKYNLPPKTPATQQARVNLLFISIECIIDLGTQFNNSKCLLSMAFSG